LTETTRVSALVGWFTSRPILLLVEGSGLKDFWKRCQPCSA
jgi:hypothetical protein